MNKLNGLLLSLLSVVLIVSTVRADDDLTIGILTSLTGNWAQVGENVQRGTSLATDHINQNGGIGGKKIKLDFQDTHEEVSGAGVVSAYRYLRSKGVSLFIGPTGVPGENSLGPIAANDPVVVISPLTGPMIQKYGRNLFNAAGTNEWTTKASARVAIARGARRAAVFGSQQPWEAQQATFFSDEFKRLGGEITAVVMPDPNQEDLRGEALSVSRSEPDVVFFAVFNRLATASRALQEYKYNGLKTAALLDESRLVGANGGLANTCYYQFTPPSREFTEAFFNKFRERPEHPADYAYDAVLILAEALKHSDHNDAESVAREIRNINLKGSSKDPLEFDESGVVKRNIVLMKVVKDALIQVPEDERSVVKQSK